MEEPQLGAHETLNSSPRSEVKLSKDEYFRVGKIVMCTFESISLLF